MQSVFRTLTHHGTPRNIHVPIKRIRIIRAIRVQTPYAPRNSKEYPRPHKKHPCNPCNPCSEPSTHHGTPRNIHVLRNNPCNPCNPCSEPLRTTELQGISTSSRKSIRVIRAIRVQNPYAPRNSKEYPRPHKKNPCNPCSRILYAPRNSKEYPRPHKKNPCNPCNPCSEPLRITELQGISTSP